MSCRHTVKLVVNPIVAEIQEIKEDIALTNENMVSIANNTNDMKSNIASTISEIATTVVETASANQNKIVECITSIHGNTNAMFETVVVKCVDQLTAVANAPVSTPARPKKFNLESYLRLAKILPFTSDLVMMMSVQAYFGQLGNRLYKMGSRTIPKANSIIETSFSCMPLRL